MQSECSWLPPADMVFDYCIPSYAYRLKQEEERDRGRERRAVVFDSVACPICRTCLFNADTMEA